MKSALSLVTNTMATSGLGLLFWIVAAQRYPEENYGVTYTVIVTMMLLAEFAGLGLRTALLKFLPLLPDRRRTIFTSYGISFLAALMVSAVFVAGRNIWAGGLEGFLSGGSAILFVASTAFWSVFILQDSVLVALRRAPWVPFENAVFGLAKLILLLPFAVIAPETGMYIAWVVPVFVIVAAVSVAVMALTATERNVEVSANDASAAQVSQNKVSRNEASRNEDGSNQDGLDRRTARDLINFCAIDWPIGVARIATLIAVPLMVLGKVGEIEQSYFSPPWVIALSTFAIGSVVADALLAESSYDRYGLRGNTIRAAKVGLAITIPIVVVGLLGAPLIMRLFGVEFRENSTTLLRWLLLGTIPNLAYQLILGRLRVQRRMLALFSLEVTLAATVVASTSILVDRLGIVGVGQAWTLSLVFILLLALTLESVWWWAGRLDTRLVRALSRGLRKFRPRGPIRGVQRRFEQMCSELAITPQEIEWSTALDDVQSVAFISEGVAGVAGGFDGISGEDDEPRYGTRLRARFGFSTAGRYRLEAERRALVEVLKSLNTANLGSDSGGSPPNGAVEVLNLPVVVGYSDEPGAEYLCTATAEGQRLSRLAPKLGEERLVDILLRTIRPLHSAGSSSVVITEADLEAWVLPLTARLRASNASVNSLSLLVAYLKAELLGRSAEVGQIHGQLFPSNAIVVVVDRDPELVQQTDVVQLQNWEHSRRAMLDIDRFTAVIGAILVTRELELSEVVLEVLDRPQELAKFGLGSPDVNPRAVVLLTWLSLVGAIELPVKSLVSRDFWLARNVQPVLSWVVQNLQSEKWSDSFGPRRAETVVQR